MRLPGKARHERTVEEKKLIKKGRKEISRRNHENIKGWWHGRQESRDFKK